MGSIVSQSNAESGKKPKKQKKSKIKDDKAEILQNGHSDPPVSIYEKALCCALAKIAGKMKAIESRSVLTAHAGLTAYRLDLPQHMTAHKKGLCYSLLSKQLDSNTTESIRNLAFIKGRRVSFGVELARPCSLIRMISF